MNRTQWIVASVVSFVIIMLVAFNFIGFTVGGYMYHNLAIAKVTDKANADVRVGLAENNADLRIANKATEDAVNALKNANTDTSTLRVKLEKAQLEKEEAAKQQLEEARRELDALKEQLRKKSEVILVPTIPTVYVAPEVRVVEVPVKMKEVCPQQSVSHSYLSGNNPRTWQECMGNFLRMATIHGNSTDIATFRAALEGKLNRSQADFLKEMAARHPGDRVFINQALINSH